MKNGFLAALLAVAGIGCCAAASAAEAGGIAGNRDENGVVFSFKPESIASGKLAFYLDTDGSAGTGLQIEGLGADYKYENGKLHIYIGDGKTQEWEALDNAIARAERKGLVIIAFKNADLEISIKSKVAAAAYVDGELRKKFQLDMPRAGKLRAPFKRIGRTIEFPDPAGDVSPECRIDFIKMFVKPHPRKPNTLMFGFTSDFPIERKKLSYHLRLMFRIGDGMGANVCGETFNYMFESPNRVFRYVGTNPYQWKWEKLGQVPARFQQQWCEIDIPLEIFKLDEMPKSFKFRLGCEHNDYVPDLRYAAPEYRVHK